MAIGNYQSDTLAFTPPPGPIRSAFDPRMRDIAYNRVPLKQGWDTLAIGRQLLRGDLTMQQYLLGLATPVQAPLTEPFENRAVRPGLEQRFDGRTARA